MPVDFLAYHESIASELRCTQDRIRNLIGSAHWLTDGEHKEAVLRKALRTHLPETCQVGRGFVCYDDRSSRQIDILVVDKHSPTLFKEGELLLTTPDTVRAIIEVKTRFESIPQLQEALSTLADSVGRVRWALGTAARCWAGLFTFEQSAASPADLLTAIHGAYNSTHTYVNCVALGSELFARYWETMEYPQVQYPAWHSYDFSKHAQRGLAHAYFLSNVVWELSPREIWRSQYAWFPISHPGGKEFFRTHCISCDSGEVRAFV